MIRRRRRRRSPKVAVEVRISPALVDRVNQIAEAERRPFTEVGGTLMLLGAGVWRRLREHPSIRKGFAFEEKAELLLLADLQVTEQLYAIQEQTAEAAIVRSFGFGERSEYYENR